MRYPTANWRGRKSSTRCSCLRNGGCDDRSIQRLLQEVIPESPLIARKGAEPPLREKFLRNMSQRAADILRDDLCQPCPVRLSQVENEQKAIPLIVRRLAENRRNGDWQRRGYLCSNELPWQV